MAEHVRDRRRRLLWSQLALVFTLLLGSTGAAWAAAETFNTALPVGVGDFVFREQGFFLKATRDPTPANRDLTAWGGVSVLGYGVTADLTLFGVLPYLNNRLDLTTPTGQRIERRIDGIGDLSLLGRYTIFQDNVPGRNFRIAPFVGIKAPSGEDRASDKFGRLPAPLQLGSGSWDAFGGVVTTYQTLNYEIDAQASYRGNTTANGFRFGDEARFDASLQYRLWPRRLSGGGVPGFLYGVLESNLIHQDRNHIAGVADRNSGGTTLLLDPGLQYVTKRWVLEAIVQLPAVQDLHGSALKNDFTVLAGFRVNF